MVGMGINVYKNAISDKISTIATSIEGEANHKIDRSKLAARIIIPPLEIYLFELINFSLV